MITILRHHTLINLQQTALSRLSLAISTCKAWAFLEAFCFILTTFSQKLDAVNGPHIPSNLFGFPFHAK